MHFGLWEVEEGGNNFRLWSQIAVNVLTSTIHKYTVNFKKYISKRHPLFEKKERSQRKFNSKCV